MLTEVAELAGFLYAAPLQYDEASWRTVMGAERVAEVLDEAHLRLEGLADWEAKDIEDVLRAMLGDLELGARKGLQPLRVAITGSAVSPPLFESMEVLGREATLARIATARARL